jgi:hypothetical protein
MTKLTHDDVHVNDLIVFLDQGGRGNPRFCKIVKITKQFVHLVELAHNSELKYEGRCGGGFLMSQEHRLTPTDKIVGVPFKRKIDLLSDYNVYDPQREYISQWFD